MPGANALISLATASARTIRKDGHWYLRASPSKTSVLRLKGKVSDILVSGNTGAWSEVRELLNASREAGARTSAMALDCRRAGRWTTMSATASGTSWFDVRTGTSWFRVTS